MKIFLIGKGVLKPPLPVQQLCFDFIAFTFNFITYISDKNLSHIRQINELI